MTPLFSMPDSIEATGTNAAAGACQLLIGGLSDPGMGLQERRRSGAEELVRPHGLRVTGNGDTPQGVCQRP